jgi:hypothetical protein
MLRSFLSNFIARPLAWLNRSPCVDAQRAADVGAPMAASLTGKPRLQVGEANVIAPAAGVDHDGVRAFVVGAIDDEWGSAGPPHFSKVIF